MDILVTIWEEAGVVIILSVALFFIGALISPDAKWDPYYGLKVSFILCPFVPVLLVFAFLGAAAAAPRVVFLIAVTIGLYRLILKR